MEDPVYGRYFGRSVSLKPSKAGAENKLFSVATENARSGQGPGQDSCQPDLQ